MHGSHRGGNLPTGQAAIILTCWPRARLGTIDPDFVYGRASAGPGIAPGRPAAARDVSRRTAAERLCRPGRGIFGGQGRPVSRWELAPARTTVGGGRRPDPHLPFFSRDHVAA